MGAFHPKLIDFGGMEVINPSFDGVKPDSLGYHVLATFATNMKRCFIPNLTTSNSLTLDNFEWFILS